MLSVYQEYQELEVKAQAECDAPRVLRKRVDSTVTITPTVPRIARTPDPSKDTHPQCSSMTGALASEDMTVTIAKSPSPDLAPQVEKTAGETDSEAAEEMDANESTVETPSCAPISTENGVDNDADGMWPTSRCAASSDIFSEPISRRCLSAEGSGVAQSQLSCTQEILQHMTRVRKETEHLPRNTHENFVAYKRECANRLINPIVEEMRAKIGDEEDYCRWRSACQRYMRGMVDRDHLAEIIDPILDRVEATRPHNLYILALVMSIRGF